MNQIDLRHFDLNLLVVFEVLMAERGVSRAAARLGRTQSAVSHSLARLREQLGDPLLLKGGRRWGRRAWSEWPHVVVRVGDQLESPVNIAAGAAGLSRTIAGWLPNFSAVAPVLAASDLLATQPAPAMAGTLRPHRLESRRVP